MLRAHPGLLPARRVERKVACARARKVACVRVVCPRVPSHEIGEKRSALVGRMFNGLKKERSDWPNLGKHGVHTTHHDTNTGAASKEHRRARGGSSVVCDDGDRPIL